MGDESVRQESTGRSTHAADDGEGGGPIPPISETAGRAQFEHLEAATEGAGGGGPTVPISETASRAHIDLERAADGEGGGGPTAPVREPPVEPTSTWTVQPTVKAAAAPPRR